MYSCTPSTPSTAPVTSPTVGNFTQECKDTSSDLGNETVFHISTSPATKRRKRAINDVSTTIDSVTSHQNGK